ncbi:hypothetical protein [Thermomonas hydrothermalis]|uniref:TFIIB-type zinc ribbon-containing protein n=1 Tax=Thermomonas hydrothermalis TaxID=213588 RepID=A0A1M4V6R9_9GAMM|nr:hypothetical protein [Thermomonas hydrothermalis]SHE64649.1 hypothetical protein SAMN02745204_00848 [Thermomonas hydrothermalis]
MTGHPLPPSPPTGPGSPRDVPPIPDGPAPDRLPGVSGDVSSEPAPAIPDHADATVKDGLNRCPKCGASDIRQKPGSDMLICLFCRHTWQGERVEEALGLGDGIEHLRGTVTTAGAREIDAGTSDLRSFKCAGCGAEVTINTQTSMTARCHWCRHVFGVNEQIENGAVPDAVLPFRIRKEDAIARIRQFVDKRRLFALKDFLEQFTPENVVGVYLPYMIVDANASAALAGFGEIQTRRYTVGSGNDRKTYYDADVYQLERALDFTVDDLPLESSRTRRNLDTRVNTQNIINAILPFDTKNAVKWNASYLVGYSTEKRDLNVTDLQPALEDQLLSIARAQVEDSVRRYDRGVRWEEEGLDLHGSRWVSMAMPVWLYSYHQPGPNGGMLHYIAVNGRTGETMGSVPVQHWKLLLAALTVGTVLETIVIWLLGNST